MSRMPIHMPTRGKTIPSQVGSTSTARSGLLQRGSVSGGPSSGDGDRAEGLRREGSDQRTDASSAVPDGLTPLVYEAIRSPGQPLDPAARILMESRFGHDFAQVRVHADTPAAESARAMKASAYTRGHDLVFGQGRYAPASQQGMALIAHELVHVLQQRGSSGPASPSLTPSGHPIESEARSVSREIIEGCSSPPIQTAGVLNPRSISRQLEADTSNPLSTGEYVRWPRMDDIVRSPTVEAARQADWVAGLGDFQERGGWIIWQGTSQDPTTGVRDDTRGSYVIVEWPSITLGAQDENPDMNPGDAIDPGRPPADDSLNFTVGSFHQHPPLDPSLHRDPASFPVGPSDVDRKLADRSGIPGVVRDFTDISRTVVCDYRFGPDVRPHK
jgi:hypothetical protein